MIGVDGGQTEILQKIENMILCRSYQRGLPSTIKKSISRALVDRIRKEKNIHALPPMVSALEGAPFAVTTKGVDTIIVTVPGCRQLICLMTTHL